jgi:GT2 family glycosyltransferase
MTGPSVTAVVLTYDGRELLEVILPSLAAQTYADFEIVVVDNGSRDDSRAYLAEHWPSVRVVAIEDNIGVAAALNRGVAATRTDLVALLNNDLELDPEWLAQLVDALERHPDAASVTGKVLNYFRREEIDGVGDLFTRSATAYHRGAGELDRGQYAREEEVFAPTAGAALYRASALARVGPFDESFWAYFEDVDWGLRAQLAGLRSWYVPSAVAYHMGSRTTGGDRNPVYFVLQRRNTLGLLIKDVPAEFIVRNLHRIAWHHLLGLGYSARAGMLRAHLRAFRDAARAAPGWRRDRRTILAGGGARREFERFTTDR